MMPVAEGRKDHPPSAFSRPEKLRNDFFNGTKLVMDWLVARKLLRSMTFAARSLFGRDNPPTTCKSHEPICGHFALTSVGKLSAAGMRILCLGGLNGRRFRSRETNQRSSNQGVSNQRLPSCVERNLAVFPRKF